MQPLVSVLMPAWNCADHICQCIESMLAQTYGDLELVVVDDGSDDGTLDAALSYDDKLLKVYEQEHKGHSWAFNHALSKATGDIIARQDCDDWSLPKRMETCLAAMGEADIVSCRLSMFIGGRMKRARHSPMNVRKFIAPNSGTGGAAAATMICTRETYDRVGPYSTQYWKSPDSEWMFRALLLDPPIRWEYVPEQLYVYRRWDGQMMSSDIRDEIMNEHYERQAHYGPLIREKLGLE